ncbi:MmgE/PrpD family protein [Pseudotabrizicola alkalilacus]|uniref:MmgE/PrpD family protein n=1 Tax=Pseudotabrizicola alkalilacus TaxID=2305252 RepID=A0A411YWH8_9RHOB|nr:MmgE/PrpD family protein [Pseudotabrizicola alkalilacus]RGP35130.1 MmgE/PrpD family protein [Pseudotabrizicola alkalilacus]
MVTRFAQWIVAARDLRLTGALRDAALRALLDLLGAAAAGVADPGVLAVRRVALGSFGAGSVPLWFTGQAGSAVAAAWANAAAASAQDLDDGNRMARGHPGAAVIPAGLAVGAELAVDFDRILTAIAIGYEVGVTIGAARTTYGNTGTWSAYAVVATAAALRGTPVDEIAHALAIAGESAPNQLFASAPPPRDPAPEGSHVKEGIPWSVVTGLVALGLAEAGHSGPRNILDSRRHYQFADGLRLGAEPRICQCYIKLYACCRHVHAPLDAMFTLISEHGIQSVEIEQIEVETTSGAMRISNQISPQNLTDLQYSIPYCLALGAIRGAGALLPLTPAALSLPGACELAARVRLVLNPEFDARFPAETLARVRVAARGQVFLSDVTAPRGEADTPLAWDEIADKVMRAGGLTLTHDHLAMLIDAVSAGDIYLLAKCLQKPGSTLPSEM